MYAKNEKHCVKQHKHIEMYDRNISFYSVRYLHLYLLFIY